MAYTSDIEDLKTLNLTFKVYVFYLLFYDYPSFIYYFGFTQISTQILCF